MSIRSEVLTQVNEVADRQGKLLAPLADDLALLDSGLDSLCFAIIVARLEDTLGIDPFSASEDVGFPVTLGEFIQFYENAAK
jgi:acyl carrier protein